MRNLYAGLAVAALVGLVAGPFVYSSFQGDADIFAQCRQGQIGGGAIGGPFTLVNGDGQTVTEQGRHHQALAGLFRLHLLPGCLPDGQRAQCRGD